MKTILKPEKIFVFTWTLSGGCLRFSLNVWGSSALSVPTCELNMGFWLLHTTAVCFPALLLVDKPLKDFTRKQRVETLVFADIAIKTGDCGTPGANKFIHESIWEDFRCEFMTSIRYETWLTSYLPQGGQHVKFEPG